MGDFSLDALGQVFGDGWLEGNAALPACPLAWGTLSMEQLFGATPSAVASLRRVCGYAPLLRDSSCWTVVCYARELAELSLSEASRRRCPARAGSGVLLDLSIILTLLVVGISFTNEVRKRAEAAYPQSTRR